MALTMRLTCERYHDYRLARVAVLPFDHLIHYPAGTEWYIHHGPAGPSANARHKQGNALIDALDTATPTVPERTTKMSNPNFVSDLVAMAKAFEELPKVQAERDDLIRESGEKSEVIQTLQLRIIDLKNSVDEKLASIKRVEAERDDAEYRFLESEDRTARALDFIRSTFGSAGSLIQALEPPAPAPVPVPPAEAEVIHQPVAVDTGPGNNHNLDIGYVADAPTAPAGQSEPGPTAHIDLSPTATQDGTAPVVTTSGEGTAAPTSDPTAQGAEVAPSAASVGSSTDAATVTDDVGYHNEPDIGADYQAWNAWCSRMQDRYGINWPQRPAVAQPAQSPDDNYSF